MQASQQQLERELAASKTDPTDTPRTDAEQTFNPEKDGITPWVEAHLAWELEIELAASKAEVERLKQGKVFVDPKWIYNLETQLAKAHEELCQAGLREYGN